MKIGVHGPHGHARTHRGSRYYSQQRKSAELLKSEIVSDPPQEQQGVVKGLWHWKGRKRDGPSDHSKNSWCCSFGVAVGNVACLWSKVGGTRRHLIDSIWPTVTFSTSETAQTFHRGHGNNEVSVARDGSVTGLREGIDSTRLNLDSTAILLSSSHNWQGMD